MPLIDRVLRGVNSSHSSIQSPVKAWLKLPKRSELWLLGVFGYFGPYSKILCFTLVGVSQIAYDKFALTNMVISD